MTDKTYNVKSNARRAARSQGLDPETAVIETKPGLWIVKVFDPLDIPPGLRRPPMAAEERATLRKKVERSNNPERHIRTPKGKSASARKTAKAKGAKAGNKLDLVKSMLLAKGGAAMKDIIKATGWLPHTARARISGIVEKHKLKITRTRLLGQSIYQAEAK